jgi:hypothetical protein
MALSIMTTVAAEMELRKMIREESNKLKEYEEMLDSMDPEEKGELREWMAHGNSVNSNPYMIYGENGRLMDFIAASRIDRDMCENPDYYKQEYDGEPDALDDGIPF